MKRYLAFALSGIILLAWAFSAQDTFQKKIEPSAGSKSPETPGARLLDRMRELAQAPALTLEVIRDSLEVDFVRDEAASHDLVTFFAGKPRAGSPFESLIKLVDCRVPTPQNPALSEPFVVVEFEKPRGEPSTEEGRRATKLSTSEVLARFGQPDSFQPALPENQESSGSYIYKLGPRLLWISLGRRAPDEVLRISIHPLEDLR